MNLKQIPILPTLLVLAAMAVMVRLGFWQLDRMEQKAALIARYETALNSNALAEWPTTLAEVEQRLYQPSKLYCQRVVSQRSTSGRSDRGAPGIAQIARCELVDPTASVEEESLREADVVLGWSREPGQPRWDGGEVAGIIAPGPRMIADPPLAGLEANAKPDPRDLPNNHLAYAVQWFLFALVALVIYIIALRKRLAAS